MAFTLGRLAAMELECIRLEDIWESLFVARHHEECENDPQREPHQRAREAERGCFMKRNKMLDIAISWLLVIGAVLVGFAGTIWFGNGNKSIAIWIGFSGVSALALGFAIQLQKFVWDSSAIAANSPAPTEAQMKETRAYIFSNSAIITNYRIGEPVKADLYLKNTGKTPAHDVRFMGKIGVDLFPPAKEPASSATVIQIGTLGQGQEIEKPSVSSFTLDGTQFHSIENGEAAIYLIGEVTYVDVYGVNCRTKFRLYYGGDNIDASRRMAIYKTGNEIGCDK